MSVKAAAPARHATRGNVSLNVFMISITVPTLAILTALLIASGPTTRSHLADAGMWTALVAIVELIPVPGWGSLRVGVGLPLFMAAAFSLPAPLAGAVAFLGASDPRELRGEVGLVHALFNRAQIALAVLAASSIFHGLAGGLPFWPSLAPGTLAVVADYLVNGIVVSAGAHVKYGEPIGAILRRLRIGSTVEFLLSYVGMGLVGLLLARLEAEVGWWAVITFLLPLLLLRQMFFRTRALEQATQQLTDQRAILRSLSNRMAEERQDERFQIAGYLHDDMAQLVFRQSIHLELLENRVIGDPEAAGELAMARKLNEETNTRIRALLRDLHESPLGPRGLGRAIQDFCASLRDGAELIGFDIRVEDVPMPPTLQLLCYQVVREAVMNAVKHAEATTISISIEGRPSGVTAIVSDDGVGFHPERGSPEGHYGLSLMRERAEIAGGELTIDSAPGRGTRVSARIPTAWFEDEQAEPSR